MSGTVLVNKNQIDILFIVVDVGIRLDNSAVLGSQVINQMKALSSFGYNIAVLACSKDITDFKSSVGKELEENNVELIPVKSRSLFLNIATFSLSLLKICKSRKVSYMYVRSIWGYCVTILASLFFPVKYIYDARGDLYDESVASGTGAFKTWLYTKIERRGIRKAYKVNAVTNYLSSQLLKRYGREANTVISCCVDEIPFALDQDEITKTRAELGFSEDDIVFVYAGGLSHYQRIPEMLTLWSKFVADENIKFLFATNEDPQSLRSKLGSLDIFREKLKKVSVPGNEVPKLLMACNVGFFLRDTRELNKAASPVKFGEYLAAGLTVVTTPFVGDLSSEVTENNLGVLINISDIGSSELQVRALIERYRQDPGAISKRARNFANLHYSWKSKLTEFSELYESARDSS